MMSDMSSPGGFLAPHRGTLILVLGILSLIICQILGPVAWIMGKGDLAQINAGRMDPEGKGLTQAGMVCGIIGTVLLALSLVIMVVYFILVVLVLGGAAAAGAGAGAGGP